MDIAVTFTVSGWRERYLRQSLDSWLRVRGVQEAHLIFNVEPSGSFHELAFWEWTRRAFASSSMVLNKQRLNVLENTRVAFARAFACGAKFAVMAEEDLAVASDTLEYFRWARDTYRDDPSVVAVCAHCRSSQCSDASAVTRAGWFNPLVCGTWKDRWEQRIGPWWGPWEDGLNGNQAWDVNLQRKIAAAELRTVFPCRSRSIHIGEVSSTIQTELSAHFFSDSQSTCFAPEYPPQRYHEVPFDAQIGVLV